MAALILVFLRVGLEVGYGSRLAVLGLLFLRYRAVSPRRAIVGGVPGKAAILRELDKRCNEFAPPGEELLAAFRAARRGGWIRRPRRTPLFVLLTTHHITFVHATWLSEEPIQTLAVVPLSRIRFTLPVPFGRGFFVSAFAQDAAGQVEEWRLESDRTWFDEAIAIVKVANLTPGGPP